MRAINKGKEPVSLTQHRSAPYSNYGNYPDAADLRESLVSEQRGICCYCLTRIRPTANAMKVEHWHSQAKHPTEDLDYSNLLGACLGNMGQPKKNQHCDTYKSDKELSINPANPTHRVEDLIRFEPNGRISSSAPNIDIELNTVLNLNEAFLVSNRKAVLDGFINHIRMLKIKGTIPRTQWERWLRDWNGESNSGELRPFCNVIVYWIRKHLK